MIMNRVRILLGITVLVIFSLACGLTSGGDPTATPKPEEPVATAAPEATATEAAPEGKVSKVEDVKDAIVQFQAEGSFVDPQVGQVFNAAGRGSGFIIDPSGLAVTNNHVVTGAALVKVWVGGETEPRNARILGTSECWDLALVDIEGDGYSYLDWYNGSVDPGLEVYAAGFPLGDPEYTLTKGIISKAKASGQSYWADVPAVIEHDARIRGGNSGGPLVNQQGEVVGVNYAGNDQFDQNFAILGSQAKDIIEKLKGGDFESMGINGQAISNEDGSLTGIWVSSVKSGSPADKAGLTGGDIITKMEGLVLATDGSMSDYCNILRTRNSTDTVSIEVLRFSTSEVLTGQFNGKQLETSFSFADQLGGEVTDPGTGDYSEYVTVQDDAGSIQVDIPSAWGQMSGAAWELDGDIIGASITAAADLDAFNNSYDEPGVFFGVSNDMAEQAGYIQVLDAYSDVFRADCKFEGRNEYQDSAYEGAYEVFTGCAGANDTLVILSARPQQNTDAFLITVFVNMMTEADVVALDRILASFDVVGTLP
jgi:serine protease Do